MVLYPGTKMGCESLLKFLKKITLLLLLDGALVADAWLM
jgi:hypothetical protein